MSGTDENRIGKRWREVHDRVRAAMQDQNRLSPAEVSFLDSLDDKLDRYEHDAFVSAAQLNWLTRIEARLSEERWT